MEHLNNLLESELAPVINQITRLPSMAKIAITLRYFATGGIQLNDADLHGVSQPSVSRCIVEVARALSTYDVVKDTYIFDQLMKK